MDKFEFYNPTKIVFGENSINKLSELIKPFGENIMLAYGGGSIKKNGIYNSVIDILKSENKNVFELNGITPNPRLEKVYEGIKICKENNIDFILAVGGGSVIDCSKAIAVGAKTDKDVWEAFYKNKENCIDAIPLGTILTISATGSEMNKGSVITNWETHEKFSYKTEYMFPKFSILDPIYTYSLPKEQIVYGSIDILAHVFEQYFSYPDESNVSDNLAEGIIKTVIENLEIALENPSNYNARSNLMWASTMALNDVIRMGKEQDWSSHGMGHILSGIYDIPHGATLSIIFPNWMKHVYKNAPNKFKKYAINIWNINPEGKTDEEIALEGINRTKEYFAKIGAPVTLKDVNISKEDIDNIVEMSNFNGSGSYRKLYKDDVREILLKAAE